MVCVSLIANINSTQFYNNTTSISEIYNFILSYTECSPFYRQYNTTAPFLDQENNFQLSINPPLISSEFFQEAVVSQLAGANVGNINARVPRTYNLLQVNDEGNTYVRFIFATFLFT